MKYGAGTATQFWGHLNYAGALYVGFVFVNQSSMCSPFVEGTDVVFLWEWIAQVAFRREKKYKKTACLYATPIKAMSLLQAHQLTPYNSIYIQMLLIIAFFSPLNVYTEWGLGVLLEVNLLLKTKDHLPVPAAAEVVIRVLLSVFPSACCYLLRITPGEQVTLLKMTWSHEESEVSQIFTVGIPTWKMQINLSNLSIIGFLFVLQWYKHWRCWIFVCF